MESPQIYKKMASVLSDIGAVEKGKKNEQQGYKFRGIDDVIDALHPVLARHEVFFVPEVLEAREEYGQTKSGTKTTTVFMKNKFTFYAPDGSSVSGIARGEAIDTADKASNKAMSASLKYMLLQTFCIPLKEMEDADKDHIESSKVLPMLKDYGQHKIISKCTKHGMTVQDLIAQEYDWISGIMEDQDKKAMLHPLDVKAIEKYHDELFAKEPA